MKSRYIVFRSPLHAEFEEEDLGQIGPDQILTCTVRTLISTGTEMTAYEGSYPESSAWARYAKYPHRPGYSNVGRAMEVGEAVEGIAEGDLIYSWSRHATHSIISAGEGTRLPDDIEPSAAAYGTLAQIALNGVRLGRPILGDLVVVAGLGPVGQLALQCAKLSGAGSLIAMDLSRKRLDVALEHGADIAVNPLDRDPVQAVEEASSGRMADIVYDVTGNQEFIPQALRLLKPRGKLVILGSPRGPVEVDFHNEVHSKGLRIIGAHNSMHAPVETPYNQWTLARDLDLFFSFIRKGRLDVEGLTSHILPWREAPKAYEMLHRNREDTVCISLDWTVDPQEPPHGPP